MANRCIEHIKKKKMRKIKKFTKKKEQNIYMIADIHPQQGKKLQGSYALPIKEKILATKLLIILTQKK